MISHPLGRAWHERLREGDAEIVPHALPDRPTLERLITDLPLRLRSFQDDPDLYLTLLQAFASPVNYLHLMTKMCCLVRMHVHCGKDAIDRELVD